MNISFAVGFSRRSSCINAYIMIARGVTNTGNGERGTGNRERESGNECTAVILMRIQNSGRKHGNRVNM